MTIALRVGHFESRLRFRFSHAAATRTLTENVIAQITDGEGRFGYGEGCPRGYVTGETAIGSAAFVRFPRAVPCKQKAPAGLLPPRCPDTR